MKRLNLIDSIKNWNRKLRWNRQYKSGKWTYLFDQGEAPRYAKIVELIKQHKKRPALLDLGAGEGVLRHKLKDNEVTLRHYYGVDFSETSIRKANALKFENSEFVVEDLHYFIPKEIYDIVVLNEAFYYINNKLKQEVLDRILSALTKDGLLIVSIFKEGGGCWPFFDHNELEKLEFSTIESPKTDRYWKIGVFRKTSK